MLLHIYIPIMQTDTKLFLKELLQFHYMCCKKKEIEKLWRNIYVHTAGLTISIEYITIVL